MRTLWIALRFGWRTKIILCAALTLMLAGFIVADACSIHPLLLNR